MQEYLIYWHLQYTYELTWNQWCLNYSNLNRKYYSGGKMAIDFDSKNILIYTNINWVSDGLNGYTDYLIFTEMKVRRKI